MKLVCGVDEVGRGPLAGPVVAAAVILDPENMIKGLADSKKLTPRARAILDGQIRAQALSFALGRAEVHEIDQLNILRASLLAMRRAVLALHCQPVHALVDGNKMPELPCSCETIVGGDATVAEISAASILAKVARDQEMEALANIYPGYGFERHKGYPTTVHLKALELYGPCEIHRRSFRPVKRFFSDEAGI